MNKIKHINKNIISINGEFHRGYVLGDLPFLQTDTNSFANLTTTRFKKGPFLPLTLPFLKLSKKYFV